MIVVLKNMDAAANNLGVYPNMPEFPLSTLAQSVLAKYTKTVDSVTKRKLDTFVSKLSNEGVYPNIDLLLIPSLAGTLTEAYTNIINDTVGVPVNAANLSLVDKGLKSNKTVIDATGASSSIIEFPLAYATKIGKVIAGGCYIPDGLNTYTQGTNFYTERIVNLGEGNELFEALVQKTNKIYSSGRNYSYLVGETASHDGIAYTQESYLKSFALKIDSESDYKLFSPTGLIKSVAHSVTDTKTWAESSSKLVLFGAGDLSYTGGSTSPIPIVVSAHDLTDAQCAILTSAIASFMV